MRLTAAVAAVLFIGLAARISLTAQAGPTLDPVHSFDIASIRQVDARDRAPMQWLPGGRFNSGVPMMSLVTIGYSIPLYRIEGLPDWVRTTYFMVTAAAGRDVEIEERPAFYRGLLRDRFKIDVHVEPRDMDVYALILARRDGRLGPGLRPSTIKCDDIVADRRKRNLAGERLPGIEPGVRPTCAAVLGPASMAGDGVAITGLAGMLGGALGRPVVDRTGLTGLFDIDFKAAPAGGRAAGPLGDELPPISTALEDQLGLKLEKSRGAVDVLVVDRIEMPTGN